MYSWLGRTVRHSVCVKASIDLQQVVLHVIITNANTVLFKAQRCI